MYKKCENCYKDGKVPNEESCKKCEDDLKAKEQECERLTSTLTEIKEIAENMNEECFYNDFDCNNCDMKNGCTNFSKKQILQKISECEGNDE